MPHLQRQGDLEGADIAIARAEHQIKRLQDVWLDTDDRARRRRAERLIKLAGGDQLRHIRKMPFEPPDHYLAKPRFAPNILALALRQLSYMYDEEPHRKMDSDPETDWAQRALWSFGMGLTNALAYADTLARLTDVCLAFVSYKPSEDAAQDIRDFLEGGRAIPFDPNADGIEVTPIDRSRFVVLENEFDARVPVAVLVRISSRIEHGVHVKRRVVRFHYWDSEVFGILEMEGNNQGTWQQIALMPHNIGQLPFVVIRNAEVGTDFEPTMGSWGGVDLEQNISTINDLITEYMWTAKLQRGQPWVRGDLKNPVLAPDAFIKLKPDGDFGITPNAANLDGMNDAVTNAVMWWCKAKGLPSRSMDHSVDAALSGVAKQLDRAELADDRRSREKLARWWERKTHRVAAAVYNASRQTNWNGNVMVAFVEPVPQLSEEQKRLGIQFELDNHLTTRVLALQALHPGMTRQQAEEQIAAVDEELAAQTPAEAAEPAAET